MDYIEFIMDKDGNLTCSYVNNNKKIKISNYLMIRLFKIIKKMDITPEKEYINGIEILRYYNIGHYINDMINFEKINANKKSKRNKNYKPILALTGSLLTLILLFNAYGNKDSKQTQDLYSTSVVTINDLPKEEDPIEEKIEIDKYFEFDYEDKSQSEETQRIKNNYYDLIEKYSKMYGLPTNLMLAVPATESKGHIDVVSKAGAYGLFQVKATGDWNWIGNQLTAYNYEINEYETVTVGLKNDGSLDSNMLFDPEYNIKIGCMIMAYDLRLCDYDILCAIQTYNYGMKPIKLKEEYGDEWINYRKTFLNNSAYIEDVLSHIDPEDNILTYQDPDNNIYNVSITNVRKNLRKRVLTMS